MRTNHPVATIIVAERTPNPIPAGILTGPLSTDTRAYTIKTTQYTPYGFMVNTGRPTPGLNLAVDGNKSVGMINGYRIEITNLPQFDTAVQIKLGNNILTALAVSPNPGINGMTATNMDVNFVDTTQKLTFAFSGSPTIPTAVAPLVFNPSGAAIPGAPWTYQNYVFAGWVDMKPVHLLTDYTGAYTNVALWDYKKIEAAQWTEFRNEKLDQLTTGTGAAASGTGIRFLGWEPGLVSPLYDAYAQVFNQTLNSGVSKNWIVAWDKIYAGYGGKIGGIDKTYLFPIQSVSNYNGAFTERDLAALKQYTDTTLTVQAFNSDYKYFSSWNPVLHPGEIATFSVKSDHTIDKLISIANIADIKNPLIAWNSTYNAYVYTALASGYDSRVASGYQALVKGNQYIGNEFTALIGNSEYSTIPVLRDGNLLGYHYTAPDIDPNTGAFRGIAITESLQIGSPTVDSLITYDELRNSIPFQVGFVQNNINALDLNSTLLMVKMAQDPLFVHTSLSAYLKQTPQDRLSNQLSGLSTSSFAPCPSCHTSASNPDDLTASLKRTEALYYQRQTADIDQERAALAPMVQSYQDIQKMLAGDKLKINIGSIQNNIVNIYNEDQKFMPAAAASGSGDAAAKPQESWHIFGWHPVPVEYKATQRAGLQVVNGRVQYLLAEVPLSDWDKKIAEDMHTFQPGMIGLVDSNPTYDYRKAIYGVDRNLAINLVNLKAAGISQDSVNAAAPAVGMTIVSIALTLFPPTDLGPSEASDVVTVGLWTRVLVGTVQAARIALPIATTLGGLSAANSIYQASQAPGTHDWQDYTNVGLTSYGQTATSVYTMVYGQAILAPLLGPIAGSSALTRFIVGATVNEGALQISSYSRTGHGVGIIDSNHNLDWNGIGLNALSIGSAGLSAWAPSLATWGSASTSSFNNLSGQSDPRHLWEGKYIT